MAKLEDDILSRVIMISRMLGLLLARDVETREEQVELLDVAGCGTREISELLGIKYGTAAAILFKIRQTKARKRAKLGRKPR